MPRTKKAIKTVKKTETKKSSAGLTIPVYDLNGKEKGTVELAKEIFAVESSPKLLAQYVRVYLANRRQGTASTKTRSEVTGSTRKIYKQKGTGRARHGDIKAPIFVGGGTVGGPKPQDYSLKFNKKQTKIALFSALSLKFKEHGIFGLSNELMKMKAKTKLIANLLKLIGLEKKRVLFVLPKIQKSNLILAARNLPNISLIDTTSINAYEILKSGKVAVIEEAFPVLEKHFLGKNKLINKHEN